MYFIAAVALCVHVKGVRGWGGANLKSVKRIVTLHWNKTNVIDNIYIYNNSSEKSKYSDEPENTL